MKELNFYGASDDCFECAGDIREEIYVYNNPGFYHLKSSEGEMMVTAAYLDSGVWNLGVAQVEEDIRLPVWPISFSQHENGYSVMLTIQVPDDIEVLEING